jgi:hypothetical protein
LFRRTNRLQAERTDHKSKLSLFYISAKRIVPPLTAYLIPGESIIEHTLLRDLFSVCNKYAISLPALRNLNTHAVV